MFGIICLAMQQKPCSRNRRSLKHRASVQSRIIGADLWTMALATDQGSVRHPLNVKMQNSSSQEQYEDHSLVEFTDFMDISRK